MTTSLAALVVAGALVVSALGGWAVVLGLLRVASRSPDSGPPPGARASEPPEAGRGGPPARASAPARSRSGVAGSATSDLGASGRGTSDPGTTDPGQSAPRSTEPDEPGPLRGGTWIGVLERLAVTGVLLAGYPAGVAFVIAVKGLGRYPELREHPGSSERFVIGTLGSLVWAAACGVGGAALLGTPVLGV